MIVVEFRSMHNTNSRLDVIPELCACTLRGVIEVQVVR